MQLCVEMRYHYSNFDVNFDQIYTHQDNTTTPNNMNQYTSVQLGKVKCIYNMIYVMQMLTNGFCEPQPKLVLL